jgi:hypothetical protein
VIHRSKILYRAGKNIIFGGQKDENEPSEPKNGIWAQKLKLVWSCDISIDRKFYMEQEKIHFRGQKVGTRLSEPIFSFWALTVYFRLLDPLKYTFSASIQNFQSSLINNLILSLLVPSLRPADPNFFLYTCRQIIEII